MGLKIFLAVVIIAGLVLAGFWAGTKRGDEGVMMTATATVSPSVTLSPPSPFYSNLPERDRRAGRGTEGVIVGNRPGNRAPDFQLKDEKGAAVSLRDFAGQEIKLEFFETGKIRMQDKVVLDPEGAVRRLYGIATIPHTVIIDTYGIIKQN